MVSSINRQLLVLLIAIVIFSSCKSSGKTVTVVKPKYHHSWTNNHVYKKKWHIGRIRLYPQKQGVKKVKMKA